MAACGLVGLIGLMRLRASPACLLRGSLGLHRNSGGPAGDGATHHASRSAGALPTTATVRGCSSMSRGEGELIACAIGALTC